MNLVSKVACPLYFIDVYQGDPYGIGIGVAAMMFPQTGIIDIGYGISQLF